MFTGIIEDIGEILNITPLSKEKRFSSKTNKIKNFVQGESIAVNGVCLTVENFSNTSFTAYASLETLGKTNLQFLKTGDKVNLERALTLSSRLGGHLVTGHVDCLARVEEITPAGESKIFRLSYPEEFSPYIISKGSVALDGISLTVNTCGPGFLEVNIIPATQKETTISTWKKGTVVNLETDIIGKYVKSFLDRKENTSENKSQSKLTLDFLREHGF